MMNGERQPSLEYKPKTLIDGVLMMMMMPECDVGGVGGWSEVKGRSEVMMKERKRERQGGRVRAGSTRM